MIQAGDNNQLAVISRCGGNCGPFASIIRTSTGQMVATKPYFQIINRNGQARRDGLLIVPDMAGGAGNYYGPCSPNGLPSPPYPVCPAPASYPTIANPLGANVSWMAFDSVQRNLWVYNRSVAGAPPYFVCPVFSTRNFNQAGLATPSTGVGIPYGAWDYSVLVADPRNTQVVAMRVNATFDFVWYNAKTYEPIFAAKDPTGGAILFTDIGPHTVVIDETTSKLYLTIPGYSPMTIYVCQLISGGIRVLKTISAAGYHPNHSSWCPSINQLIVGNTVAGPLFWKVNPVTGAITPTQTTTAVNTGIVMCVPNTTWIVATIGTAPFYNIYIIDALSDTVLYSGAWGGPNLDGAAYNSCTDKLYVANGSSVGGGVTEFDPASGFANASVAISSYYSLWFDRYANMVFSYNASNQTIYSF